MSIHRKLTLTLGLLVCGCSSDTGSFDREVELAKRAALGELAEEEKQKLLSENHPVLLQVADPAIRRLLKLFAELPEEQQEELKTKKFLKWKYAELDRMRQEVFTEVLTMNMRMLYGDQPSPRAKQVLNMLPRSDLGFAIVDIPSSGEHVVSCFVLWPDQVTPTWVAVANAKALKAKDAMDAHMLRLPMLKNFETSKMPIPMKNVSPDSQPLLTPPKGSKMQLFTRFGH
jgi:hypothetical protein